MKHIFFLVLSVFSFQGFSQSNEASDIYGEFMFDKAFSELSCMLEDTCQINFQSGVFAVENAYLNGELSKELFDLQIASLLSMVNSVIAADNLIYSGEDRETMKKNAAIFIVMCDSFPVHYKDTVYTHLPFAYDFNDIWGHSDWSSMFVSKLLHSRKGNCHSLPYLYKILASNVGTKASLAVAPNHFYIKQFSKTNGWYNTELTSGQFPVDAWLMASGYIHLDAVVNKLYMEALSEKKSVAVLVTDLAKAYQKRFGVRDGIFIGKCIELVEKHYPNYVNMLILKLELTQLNYERMMEENNVEHASEIFYLDEAKELFADLQNQAINLHTLGYRKMPEEMYLDWLVSLNEQKQKFSNKKLSNFK